MLFRALPSLMLLSTAMAFLPTAFAENYTIDAENSVFAIITHKTGIASRLGHNHFIYVGEYDARLSADNGDPTTCSFEISFLVDSLIIAENDNRDRWFEDVRAAGILDKPLQKTSETNRAKIREHMLAAKQLDAENYPRIKASLKSVRGEFFEQSGKAYTHVATIEMTIRDTTVTHDFPAVILFQGDTIEVEAVAALKFTDFGIKPYSAILRTVRNKDEFHFYINFSATRSSIDNE